MGFFSSNISGFQRKKNLIERSIGNNFIALKKCKRTSLSASFTKCFFFYCYLKQTETKSKCAI